MDKEDEYYRKRLTPEQYVVLREGGTEQPFAGKYNRHREKGMYHCAACGAELFSSAKKFDSGTGWPSFSEAADSANVKLADDTGHGMHRVEVRCAKCDSHLGHVFNDSHPETGKRYCINSVCLDFKKSAKPAK